MLPALVRRLLFLMHFLPSHCLLLYHHLFLQSLFLFDELLNGKKAFDGLTFKPFVFFEISTLNALLHVLGLLLDDHL